jgi:hypothetical protein
MVKRAMATRSQFGVNTSDTSSGATIITRRGDGGATIGIACV